MVNIRWEKALGEWTIIVFSLSDTSLWNHIAVVSGHWSFKCDFHKITSTDATLHWSLSGFQEWQICKTFLSNEKVKIIYQFTWQIVWICAIA